MVEASPIGRPRSSARWFGATLILFTSVAASVGFLFVAYIFSTFDCEDGCPYGSRWAPGAPGAVTELWALAVPAAIAAFALCLSIALGRRWISVALWLTMTALLVVWCGYTGVSNVSIDFSASNSHWMWFAGLLVAGGGGLVGVSALFV